MSTQPAKPSGFTTTMFDKPFEVTLFPASQSFNPAPGLALGVELNNLFGSERLIVRYTGPITRKVSNKHEQWPDGLVYVSERDVSGWQSTKANA